MRPLPIGRLMLQADFGRTSLNRPALLVASHYRLVVALLTAGLIAFHLPFVGQPQLLLGALTLYLIYVVVRFGMPSRLEADFYTPRVQFWRAQVGIFGVTALLLALGGSGEVGSLWILYLPALMLVSRHCDQQRTYFFVAAQVAALAGLAHLFELQSGLVPSLPGHAASAVAERAFAVLLPSFLVHYLARVDITAKRGSVVRDQIIDMLLERVLLDTDPLALWWSIREACGTAVSATGSDLYLYDQARGRLQRVERAAQGYALGEMIALDSDRVAAQAIRRREIVELTQADDERWIAAPIQGQPDPARHALAVVVLRFRAASSAEVRALRSFLTDLLRHIWPICAYAGIRQQFPLLDQIDDEEVHSLRLDQVIDAALETLCSKLGFSFATISLVNEDEQEIETVRGRNVPEGWVADAHHLLDSHDIQADVLRTGKVEIITGYDPRFDAEIWSRYNHIDLVRAWAPLDHIGTIEAGFYKRERGDIPALLVEMLKRYARDVTIAVRNAQLYEREQRQTAVLARLHEASYDLQIYPQQHDETRLLEQIAQAALDVLGASIVMVYPLNRRDASFAASIYAGDLAGPLPLPLPLPEATNNIVKHIAESRMPYYQPDAQRDPLLAGDTGEKGSEPVHRTFTLRQNILSFAGAPLLARGKLLGVLCVNYRERHQFSPYDQQVITLFAQQAAAVIASGQLVRDQERRRLEYDLHDSVKSSVRGLILFSRAATDALERDPCIARKHLHEVRRIAWSVLADVNIILHDLEIDGSDGRAMNQFIRDELRRIVGREWSKLALDLDEDLSALPMTLTRTLLYLMREAVSNALEYADASAISVGLHCVNDRLRLTVGDDGRGFAPETVVVDGELRGLSIMRERADMLGGTLEIRSSPGNGTLISVDLPR